MVMLLVMVAVVVVTMVSGRLTPLKFLTPLLLPSPSPSMRTGHSGGPQGRLADLRLGNYSNKGVRDGVAHGGGGPRQQHTVRGRVRHCDVGAATRLRSDVRG